MVEYTYNFTFDPDQAQGSRVEYAAAKPQGIAAKPQEDEQDEAPFLDRFYSSLSSFFSSTDEAKRVLSSKSAEGVDVNTVYDEYEAGLSLNPEPVRTLERVDDLGELALRSSEEAALYRMEQGTTDARGSTGDLITQDIEARNATPSADNDSVSDSKDEQEATPVTVETPVATQGAGLMSQPVEGTASEVDTGTTVEEGETVVSSRLNRKGLTPITLTDKAQEKLFDLGFVEVGTADGVAGANTRRAARRYQGESDLTVNGQLDADTLGSLTSATADLDTIMQRQISHHEGKKNYPYKDSLGLWTIGIGHLIGRGRDEDLANSGYNQYSRENPMPDSEVTELFKEDLADHKAIAEGYDFYDDMNEKGKRAIIDLTFNMGDFLNKRNDDGDYMWANLRRQLANSEWDAAADNLASATYGRQVGQRAITVTDMLRQAGN